MEWSTWERLWSGCRLHHTELVLRTGQPPQPVGKVAHQRSRSAKPCAYNRCMNKTTLLNSPQTLQDLQDYMFDTMLPAEMCVDWFCERFNVSADDDIIDFVVDAHFGMFADQWCFTLKFSRSGIAKRQTISLSSVNSTTKCSGRIMRSPTKHLPLILHSSPTIDWD